MGDNEKIVGGGDICIHLICICAPPPTYGTAVELTLQEHHSAEDEVIGSSYRERNSET